MSLEEITQFLESITDANGNILVEQIYNLLNRYEPNKLIYCLKSRFPNIQLEYIFDQVNNPHYNQVIARDDSAYRAAVKSRFITCIICEPGKCHSACCEVAHIWNFADCDAMSKYNPDNGILLCANWHKLFDSHMMQLEPIANIPGMVQIILADTLQQSLLGTYHGKVITIMPENIPFLMKRNIAARHL